MQPRDKKTLLRIVGIIYGFFALFVITYIWRHTNVFQIDFGGQIASAQLFANNGMHGRSMNWFAGLINNLFYPPIQDFIVYIIHGISGMSIYHAFLIYITLLVACYFGSFVYVASKFNKWYIIVLYAVGGLMFLGINKFPNIAFLQGLSTIDIIFTGLVSEILGCVFLQLLIAELRDKKRPVVMTLFACLSFLSHLVIGPVAMLVLFLYLIINKPHRWWGYALAAFGLTAFFRLPLIYYKGLMSSSNIIDKLPEAIIGILIISLFFTNRKSPVIVTAITGIIIIMPTEVASVISTFSLPGGRLPSFHYYRFGIIGILLGLVSFVGLLDEYVEHKLPKKYLSNSIIGSMVVLGLLVVWYFQSGFGGTFWGPMTSQLGYNPLPTQKDFSILENLDPNKRILTVDSLRPGDAGLDSLDQYMGYQNNFVKGLFWESSKSNHLLCSYLATLLGPQNIVLNYYFQGELGYPSYSNLWNYFVNDYSIGYLLVAPTNRLNYMTPNTYKNFMAVLQSGTSDMTFAKMGETLLNGMDYSLYSVNIRTGSKIQNTLASIVKDTPSDITVDGSRKFFGRDIFNGYSSNITKGSGFVSYLIHDKQSSVEVPDVVASSGQLTFIHEKDNKYKLTLSGSDKARVQVKISPLPGRHMEDKQGTTIKTYALPYGIYAEISGTTYLVYERSWVMKIGYIISILTSLSILYIYRKPIIQRKRNFLVKK